MDIGPVFIRPEQAKVQTVIDFHGVLFCVYADINPRDQLPQFRPRDFEGCKRWSNSDKEEIIEF